MGTDVDVGSDTGTHQGDTTEDLTNYQLARDRVRRTSTRLPGRFSDSEMIFYALTVAEQL